MDQDYSWIRVVGGLVDKFRYEVANYRGWRMLRSQKREVRTYVRDRFTFRREVEVVRIFGNALRKR